MPNTPPAKRVSRPIAAAVYHGQPQRREQISRRAAGDNDVRARGRDPPHALTSRAQPAQLHPRQAHLQLGQQLVFLVTDILPQEEYNVMEQLVFFAGAGLQRVQPGRQLIDLLMLEFHPEVSSSPLSRTRRITGYRTASSA